MSQSGYSRLRGRALAGKVAIDALFWHASNGAWLNREGKRTGFLVAKTDEPTWGDWRPDLDWSQMRVLIDWFGYCHLRLADRDTFREGSRGPHLLLRAGQWECKLVEQEDPDIGRRTFYAIAETAPLAVCHASLKAADACKLAAIWTYSEGEGQSNGDGCSPPKGAR